jgi:signal peptidase II
MGSSFSDNSPSVLSDGHTRSTATVVSAAGIGWIAIVVFLSLVAADLVTKEWVINEVELFESIPVIEGFFDIVHVKNRGSAFGFLASVEGDWVRYFFLTLHSIAFFVFVWLYKNTPASDRLTRMAFVLIASGAVGNFIDRLRFGAVTDFLLVYIGDYRWPAFNVADSCITIGVAFLAWRLIVRPHPDSSSALQ